MQNKSLMSAIMTVNSQLVNNKNRNRLDGVKYLHLNIECIKSKCVSYYLCSDILTKLLSLCVNNRLCVFGSSIDLKTLECEE